MSAQTRSAGQRLALLSQLSSKAAGDHGCSERSSTDATSFYLEMSCKREGELQVAVISMACMCWMLLLDHLQLAWRAVASLARMAADTDR